MGQLILESLEGMWVHGEKQTSLIPRGDVAESHEEMVRFSSDCIFDNNQSY